MQNYIVPSCHVIDLLRLWIYDHVLTTVASYIFYDVNINFVVSKNMKFIFLSQKNQTFYENLELYSTVSSLKFQYIFLIIVLLNFDRE